MTNHSESEPAGGLSRRRFLQAAAAVGSPISLVTTSRADGVNLEAYTSATSYRPGETLVLYARDPQGIGSTPTNYPLYIGRAGWPDVDMMVTSVAVANQAVPADASMNGCRWAPTFRLTIPGNWPSGLYWVTLSTGANQCNVPFVVKAARATAGVKVLVQIPVTTEHAYNNYGGKSLYGYNSSDGVPATQVSFDRPFSDWSNSSFDPWQWSFVRWLAKNNIAADYCTSVDLHADSGLLDPYQLVLSAGHDEYWSREMRNSYDKHLKGGGNVAMFSGNTCWWQVRFASSAAGPNRTLVCYKSAAADPTTNPTLETINWQDLVPTNPSNTTTGLNFIKGASWTDATPRQPAPYVVQRPAHWAFAGTGVGASSPIVGEYVGYETDACDFTSGSDGRFYPTGLDGTPATARILAQADCTRWAPGVAAQGYAQMLVFSRGGSQGTLFNGGTTDWAYGMLPELNGQAPTPISTITLNVINKLKNVYSESADVRQFRTTPANGPASYYYTTSTQGPAGSVLDGAVFNASTALLGGMLPVYRYRSIAAGAAGPRYRYSQSILLSRLQWVLEAIAFYAYPFSRQGVLPVYEFYAVDARGATCFQYATSQVAPPGWLYNGICFFTPAA